jgi:hypothetical protein
MKPQSLPLTIEAAELGAELPLLLVEVEVDELLEEDDARVEVLFVEAVLLPEAVLVMDVELMELLPEAVMVGMDAEPDMVMEPEADDPEAEEPDDGAPPPVTAKRGL